MPIQMWLIFSFAVMFNNFNVSSSEMNYMLKKPYSMKSEQQFLPASCNFNRKVFIPCATVTQSGSTLEQDWEFSLSQMPKMLTVQTNLWCTFGGMLYVEFHLLELNCRLSFPGDQLLQHDGPKVFSWQGKRLFSAWLWWWLRLWSDANLTHYRLGKVLLNYSGDYPLSSFFEKETSFS